MPKLNGRIPKYCHHKASGRGFVKKDERFRALDRQVITDLVANIFSFAKGQHQTVSDQEHVDEMMTRAELIIDEMTSRLTPPLGASPALSDTASARTDLSPPRGLVAADVKSRNTFAPEPPSDEKWLSGAGKFTFAR